MSRPDLSRLTPAAARLFAAFPVRKSKKQKAAFRDDLCAALEALGWPVAVEETGTLVKSHNVVAGDAAKARVLFTAHYDTPARLPLPNFIAPRNLLATVLFQLALAAVICAGVFAGTFGVAWLSGSVGAGMWAGVLLAGAAVVLMLAGPANPRNANDNTSGTLTLLEIAAALPPEARANAALIFFDNEELGLIGAYQYRRKHPEKKDGLLLNFDCVGDGDTLLFTLPRALRRGGTAEALKAAFLPDGGHALIVDTSPFTLYPSDQQMFRRGAGVVALRRAPLVGLYVSRIHTGRDTVLQQDNLLWLAAGAVRLVQGMV